MSTKAQRTIHLLLTLALSFLLYLSFILYLSLVLFYEFPSVSLSPPSPTTGDVLASTSTSATNHHHIKQDIIRSSSPLRHFKRSYRLLGSVTTSSLPPTSPILSTLTFLYSNTTPATTFSELHQSAARAWELGGHVFAELNSSTPSPEPAFLTPANETCPRSVMLTGEEIKGRSGLMVIPCGLTLGSHITLVARPLAARPEYSPKMTEAKEEELPVMVSQFVVELQGLKAVDGEAPPKILHFNPRLKGDSSGRPVIEQNTCYRMQWGSALRCDGRQSAADEKSVDGLVKCEKWIREDDDGWLGESKTTLWLNQLIGNSKKAHTNWMYPFVEDKLFVLTMTTGLEGYHVAVDGRHVTSFPYHPGFALEDATGLVLYGDLEIQSLCAASLPASHPNFSPQRSLQFSPEWKAPQLPNGPVELFIGILSAGNHFAERMAMRKSWMSSARKSSDVVARFFVALHGRKEVNIELKKEAEFFGDIVIVPYMDSYDLVVLKTVAICEFGVHTVSANYIMKCDDDTFVRVDSVIEKLKKIPSKLSLYWGNMNYYHKPLRHGKWAVTYEEWPEKDYPPYANGPGYIISSDIARFVVSEFESRTLKLFKMEDVSMGMWVGQFNDTKPVEYLHSLKFCQFGCINGYLTAHYQSPRQMMCLWEKLRAGKPQCCNMG